MIILSEKVRTIVTNFCEKDYWTIIPITIVLGLFCQKIVSFAA